MQALRRWGVQHQLKGLAAAVFLSALLHVLILYQVFMIKPPALLHDDVVLSASLLQSIPPQINAQKPALITPAQPNKPDVKPPSPSVMPEPNMPGETALDTLRSTVSPKFAADDGSTASDALNDAALDQANSETLLENPSADASAALAPSIADTTADAPIPINAEAYQYVETYFDVRTDTNSTANAPAAGQAKIVFQLSQDGTAYQIDSFTAPKGLAAIFISHLTQKSMGRLTSLGLQPTQYDYQYGDKADKTYRADFDWTKAQLNLTTSKGAQQVALVSGTQDLLSFMYQFMYVPPLNNLQLSITNGKKLSLYNYLFEGEELLATKMGEVNTLHIARENDDHDEKTDLWLAMDYQYLPVKIRKTEKNGKVYELLATKIVTKTP